MYLLLRVALFGSWCVVCYIGPLRAVFGGTPTFEVGNRALGAYAVSSAID